YYWRDYIGVIPPDAIEGGTDGDGNPTYIGQVYIPNKILPAVITRGCAIAKTTAHGNFVTIDQDIKENFEWISARNQDIHSLTDRHFVMGGRSREHPLYIGRTYYDSKLIIGKVFGDSSRRKGLAIPYKGKRIVVQTYEVLTYNVDKQTDPIPVELDIDMPLHTSIIVIIVQLSVQIFASCPSPSSNTENSLEFPGYYWRDYTGIIPPDAIEGGTDESGSPTYIGQVYIKEYELLPAIITRGCKTVITTAYGEERTSDKNTKILCARDKRKFEWVPTKSEETHLMTNRHFVIGGTEIGHNLNIGRINHGGRLLTGKIFSYPLPNRGLAVPYEGKPIVYQSYEILTYNVSKYSDNAHLMIDIDVRSQ
ncbi:hypothetical protein ILUMI_08277, partial [Ignelater luminosus]